MRALTRKLVRDVVAMRGQALAIALVLAAGIAMFVAYFGTFASLERAMREYYEASRFADVFTAVRRAPLSAQARLADIDGVARADARVVVDVTIDVAGVQEPLTGRLVSLSLPRRPMLNDVWLRAGRDPDPARDDEVLVNEAFAAARRLHPGDRVGAIINGRRRELQIVGIALSPEYVYSIRPGDLLPDTARFGIFWIDRRRLAAAFDMEGGFNDVAIALAPGASPAAVIAAVDRTLAPYGAIGAIPRRLQTSNWFLENELTQLRTAGVIVPAVFLMVAAFLLNIALNRITAVQREQIAALKAMGYSNGDLAWHYVQWSLVVAAAGVLLGVLGGIWLGHGMTAIYQDFFRFPALAFRLSPADVLSAIGVGVVAATGGALAAVKRVSRLAPAQAMRPPAPERFRQTWLERPGIRRRLTPAALMTLRNLTRQPVRAALSIVGTAFAVAILVVGLFFVDAIDILMRVQFETVQRQDVTVTFAEPVSSGALESLRRLPGVLIVEPLRVAPVRIRHGHRSRTASIIGLSGQPVLNRIVSADLRVRAPASNGLTVSTGLAAALALEPGDVVAVDVLEGRRPTVALPVFDVVTEYMGTSVYMERDALSRLLREAGSLSGAFLRIDSSFEPALYRELKATPAVAGVTLKRAALESFQTTIQEHMSVMIFFNVLFACIIAFGVVYNAARIVLSERSRDLASLRILGFTRAEVGAILVGELSVIVVLAVPVGLLIGQVLGAWILKLSESELYRFPMIVTARTRVFAAVVVLVAGALSALTVRRRLNRLDLVAVLKTRE
jgi:putative ABC transport system permease protein